MSIQKRYGLIVVLGFVMLLCVLSGVVLAQYQQYRAEALTAQALLTANETAQTATRAASLSSVLLLVVLILVLLLLLVGGLFLFVGYVRRQRRQQRSTERSWLPGPNARWGRAGTSVSDANALPDLSGTLNTLIQMQLLQAMQQLFPASSPRALMPPEEQSGTDVWYPQ
jgi:hypothetical protein